MTRHGSAYYTCAAVSKPFDVDAEARLAAHRCAVASTREREAGAGGFAAASRTGAFPAKWAQRRMGRGRHPVAG
eukprot:COSAG06_NODE_39604_length_410_cov_4.858521_2_plen_73_part_01